MAALLVFAVGHEASAATAALGGVTLEWTAPGDDGMTGTATTYALRYSWNPITLANWANATLVTPGPVPLPAGTLQRYTVTGLIAGTLYYFAIRTADERGNWSGLSNVVARSATSTVAVGDGGVPLRFSAPYPNPSRNSASFSIGLPRDSEILVQAYDIQGREVRTLASGNRPAGEFHLIWDLRDNSGVALGAGVYLVRAVIDGQRFMRRVIVSN
jgi:hypothetical protein